MNSVSYDELMSLKPVKKEKKMNNDQTNVEAVTDNMDVSAAVAKQFRNEPAVSGEITFKVQRVYPKGLMDMNRLTRDGREIVKAQGHSKNSFKRNYDKGIAHYVCQNCGAVLSATLSNNNLSGGALEPCLKAVETTQ